MYLFSDTQYKGVLASKGVPPAYKSKFFSGLFKCVIIWYDKDTAPVEDTI